MGGRGAVVEGEIVAGKYVLRERIGVGGMGVVYAAEQLALARTVAIKLLHEELVPDAELVRQLEGEARTASRLSHPNVAAMLDVGRTDDGRPFLVMEHVRGDTLAELVRAGGPMPVERAAALVAQVLAALDAAHAAGVVHADVKSDNVIVLAGRDGAEIAKVVDFGLARTIAEARRAPIDADGLLLVSGTPEYMAPEVVRGEPPRVASDLYGAGVILYELVTGTTPFGGGTSTEILIRQVQDEVVPPSLRRPHGVVPPALDEVALRALAKDPAARFAEAAAFAAALTAAVPARDPARSRRCDACGVLAPARSRFCPECGAADEAWVARRAVTSDDRVTETMPAPPRVRLARGSTPPVQPRRARSRERALREAIGDAIAAGDPDDLARAYLGLARFLVARGRERDAVRELEEGVDMLTAGAGARARHAPPMLWQLLAALASIHAASGAVVAAQRAALAAYQQASASHSVVGRDRARALIDRLSRAA
jgi:serine/threonine-protein kinase